VARTRNVALMSGTVILLLLSSVLVRSKVFAHVSPMAKSFVS